MTTHVALVGLGAAAQNLWLPAVKRTRGVTLVAGADPSPDAQRAFSALAPSCPTHPDLPTLLESHRSVDWVLVATPPRTHVAVATAALEASRHVLCEKPLAGSVAAIDALAAVAERAGRTLAVNHELSRMRIFAATLARLRGSPPRFAHVWQTVATHTSPGWREAGDVLGEFGPHPIDLLIDAFGGSPAKATARLPNPDGAAGTPVVLLTLEWPDGRAAHLTLDRMAPGRHRYLEARFDCADACLRATFGGRADVRLGIDPRTRRPRVRWDLGPGGLAWVERGQGREVYARNPLNALADATSTLLAETLAGRPVGVSRARAVAAVIEAARRSAAEERTVAIGA